MAEQHYVYQPTIRDLENYTDMVGYEKAQVKISHFNPNELEEENKITVPTDNYKDPESLNRCQFQNKYVFKAYLTILFKNLCRIY